MKTSRRAEPKVELLSEIPFHEDLHRHDRVVAATDRAFGFTIAAVFLFLTVIQLWGGAVVAPAICFVLASLIAMVAALRPHWLEGPNRIWLAIGLALHRVTNPVILGFLFFFVICPVALILRLARKDLLRSRLDPLADNYWIRRRSLKSQRDSMTNQF